MEKSETEKFIESLSPKDKELLREIDTSNELSQEETTLLTYERILDMGVAGGQMTQETRDRLISDFKVASS